MDVGDIAMQRMAEDMGGPPCPSGDGDLSHALAELRATPGGRVEGFLGLVHEGARHGDDLKRILEVSAQPTNEHEGGPVQVLEAVAMSKGIVKRAERTQRLSRVMQSAPLPVSGEGNAGTAAAKGMAQVTGKGSGKGAVKDRGRELGQALARGTPTPPAWIARHGDQRVPLLLTVPCNDVPFRIPDAVLHALQADAALPGKWPQEGFDAEQTPRGEPAAAAAEAPPGGGSEAYSRHGSMVSSRSGIAGMGTLQQASFRSSRSVKSQDDVCVSPT